MRNRSRSTTPQGERHATGAAVATERPHQALPEPMGPDGCAVAGVDAPAAQAMGTSSLAFWQTLLFDVAFWVAVYGGRAYTREPVSGRMPHHFCVAHYIAVLTVTDVVFFVCPPTRRHWFHPFRVTGALQVAGLVLQLLHNGDGVDGTTWWSALRLLACVVRAADGVLGMWRSGLLGFSWPQLVPTSTTAEPPGAALRAWTSLAAFCPTVPGPVTFELLVALIFLSFPAVASSTHYNCLCNGRTCRSSSP
jgi:hypothetical protein